MLVLTASGTVASGVGLGFSCDDVDRTLRRLAKAGVETTMTVQEGHWGERLGGFVDPEGNHVYLESPSRKKPGSRRHRSST